jgi:DNA mismatch repair protein MutL
MAGTDRGADADGDADADADATVDGGIRRLDDRTVDRIAAGEVVTRPADVVRELVENAIDAGAESVEVTVEGGGTESIRVVDDGCGMAAGDAPLAVAHHATSKLTPDGDGGALRRVATLGFRGEALASIATVAHLEVTTNDGGARATRVVVDRDATADDPRVEPAGRGRGTTVVASDLFYNRPARRKSLASPRAEFARISDVVTRYALVRPDLRFRLVHDGNDTLATPGSGSFVDAALAVYDRGTAARATTFDHEATLPAAATPGVDGTTGANDAGDVDRTARVDGLLCFPDVTRASRESIHVAVNGRALGDATVRAAVVDGYGSLLPAGRAPVAVVRLALPPGAVDANVHPAKREVGYADADAVADLVATAVRDALSTADLRQSGEVAMDLDASLRPLDAASAFGDVTVIGGYRDLYLLCEADDDLLVVDQHAAHERINFERLRAALDGEGVPSRDLAAPETVSLSPPEAAAVEARRGDLERLGFGLESFGGRTYRVVAVPAPLGRPADVDALREAVAALAADGDGDAGADARDPRAVREDLLRDLACHPSLKAGDALDDDVAADLVERLGQCATPYTCPHGRPTVLSLDEATLAKGFGRTATRLE